MMPQNLRPAKTDITHDFQTVTLIANAAELLFDDLASSEGQHPLIRLTEIERELTQCQLKLDMLLATNKPYLTEKQNESYLLHIKNTSDQIHLLIKKIEEANSIAVVTAGKMIAQHESIINRLQWGRYKTTAMFSQDSFSLFEGTATAQQTSWVKIKDKLKAIYELAHLKNHQNNMLGLLLTPDDTNFFDIIDSGKFSFGDEIGHLALARLKEIAASPQRDSKLAARAKRFLHNHMSYSAMNPGEGLFYFTQKR